MELWIRSQDKETLVKINNIWANENVIYTDSYSDMWLGAYKSKKRALEVLDEIQNLFKPPMIIQKTEGVIATTDNTMHIINPTYGEIKELSTIVYEMPKE